MWTRKERKKERGGGEFFLLVTKLGLGTFILKEIKTVELYYVMSFFSLGGCCFTYSSSTT